MFSALNPSDLGSRERELLAQFWWLLLMSNRCVLTYRRQAVTNFLLLTFR